VANVLTSTVEPHHDDNDDDDSNVVITFTHKFKDEVRVLLNSRKIKYRV
jgi:hypothetical protein